MERKKFRGFCLNGCGNQVFSRDAKTKYCSLTCAQARNKKQRVARPCLSCAKTVPLTKQKFCSLACQHAYQFHVRVIALEQGTYHTYNCNGFVRKYLIWKLGEQCSRCGWNQRHPKTGRVPVEVEHIDGNWENNRPENLTLLCPNCHSLTDTFRGLNRGRGRATRRGGRNNPLPPQPVQRDDKSKVARLPQVASPGQASAGRQLSLLPPACLNGTGRVL